jgi:hypothetical protein
MQFSTAKKFIFVFYFLNFFNEHTLKTKYARSGLVFPACFPD